MILTEISKSWGTNICAGGEELSQVRGDLGGDVAAPPELASGFPIKSCHRNEIPKDLPSLGNRPVLPGRACAGQLSLSIPERALSALMKNMAPKIHQQGGIQDAIPHGEQKGVVCVSSRELGET